MPTFGSSTAPSFAGWQWVGSSGQAVASLWQSPAFDVYVTALHVYFNTYQGNGAIGRLAMWSGNDSIGNPLLADTSGFVINNGTLNAGGQQWWTHPITPVLLPANTKVWIGGWSSQGIVWSTYDTSPHAFYKAMGTSSQLDTSFFNSPYRTDTGQGPIGSYADYSKVIYPGTVTLGNRGGGLASTGSAFVFPPLTRMGGAGGIAPVNSTVRAGGTATMGGMGGIAPVGVIVNVPKMWIWRPM